jgi:hypothetical protein
MSTPQTVGLIPPQSHAPSASISLDIKPYFSDLDATDVLTFSAAGFPASTALSISSTTGVISGTPNGNDLAASFVVTVTATDSHSHTRQTTISFITATAPSAAQNFYVNGLTGNDAWDGLSATFTSGTNGPWRTIARSNTVPAHGSGHTDIWVHVDGSPYRNDCWTPANAGATSSRKIRLRVNGSGPCYLMGPATGSVLYAYNINNKNHIEIMRESATTRFVVDGEVSFGTGTGQIAKGDNPQLAAHLQRGGYVDGTAGIVLDYDHVRTAGWSGIDTPETLNNIIFRINTDQHGTPYAPPGVDGIETVQDYGDVVYIPPQTPQTNRWIFDGGTTGRYSHRGGHATFVIYGATGCLRGYKASGLWGTLPTFAPGDGNRTFQFGGRSSLDWHMYNCVLERNGQPVDQPRVEITKLEGTRTVIADSILRHSDHNVFEMSTAPWSTHSRSTRACHSVYEHIKGMIVSLTDYDAFGSPGLSIPDDIQLKNLIFKHVSYQPDSGYTNVLVRAVLNTGNWADMISMHGITVEDATRDGDDFLIEIFGAGINESRNVTWWLANHPSNFSNWTFTTDANLDNAPAEGGDADLLDIQGEYTPVSDSLSVNQGVNLTTANGAGSSSTSLAVHDGTWFDDPADGVPGFGYNSEGFFVHLGGVGNVQYTAISRSAFPSVAATLTLSAAQTWSNGAAVNKKIYSGSAPNRGVR